MIYKKQLKNYRLFPNKKYLKNVLIKLLIIKYQVLSDTGFEPITNSL